MVLMNAMLEEYVGDEPDPAVAAVAPPSVVVGLVALPPRQKGREEKSPALRLPCCRAWHSRR